MNTVQFSSPNLPPPSYHEIARYMKAGTSNQEAELLIGKSILECEKQIVGKIAYSEFPIHCTNGSLDLGFATTTSSDLEKLLCDNSCSSIILFSATIGLGIDRLLFKYSRTSPATALCIQAIGAERVEALCNAFSLEMKEKYASLGCTLTPRFSPGYGDLPLSLQKDIFAALDCEKHLGLTLNDSLLMSPTKSVTAIIGIKKTLRTTYENS